MSIKPVAKVKHSVTGFIDWLGPLDLVEGTKLYAIPDTHRVVSVELLERVEKFSAAARDHYSVMNDEVCQSYSEPWQQGVAVCKELQAIIDKEPPCPSA